MVAQKNRRCARAVFAERVSKRCQFRLSPFVKYPGEFLEDAFAKKERALERYTNLLTTHI
jgi:hypothetical protein